MGDQCQTGIVACASVDDYETSKIKRHEHTIKKKEDDRTKLTNVQGANVGPVFLTYHDEDCISKRMMEIAATSEPYKSVTCDDGVHHIVWLCSEEDSKFFCEKFESIDHLYVADGHHRTAAAYNVGKMRRDAALEAGHEVTGEEPFNYFMSIIYPDSQLKIMDYNRVIKSLNGLTAEEFLEKLGQSYDVRPLDVLERREPTMKFECSLYLDEKWYKCKVKEDKIDLENPVKSLDTQLLTDLVLTPILGIENIRTDERIDFVGGIRGLNELEKRCKEDCVAAFAMYAVQMDELMRIADNDMIMPPKSTWFEPKPRSGFVVRVFDA